MRFPAKHSAVMNPFVSMYNGASLCLCIPHNRPKEEILNGPTVKPRKDPCDSKAQTPVRRQVFFLLQLATCVHGGWLLTNTRPKVQTDQPMSSRRTLSSDKGGT